VKIDYFFLCFALGKITKTINLLYLT